MMETFICDLDDGDFSEEICEDDLKYQEALSRSSVPERYIPQTEFWGNGIKK